MKKKVLILGVLSIFLGMNFQAIAGATIAVGPDTITQTDAEQLIIDLDATNLPSYFSWRDINGIDYTTDIRNQVPFASCEAFAIVAAIETMVQYKVGFPFGCDLSEAHLFFNSNGSQLGWGTYPESDLRYLQKYGIPDEARADGSLNQMLAWASFRYDIYPENRKLYPASGYGFSFVQYHFDGVRIRIKPTDSIFLTNLRGHMILPLGKRTEQTGTLATLVVKQVYVSGLCRKNLYVKMSYVFSFISSSTLPRQKAYLSKGVRITQQRQVDLLGRSTGIKQTSAPGIYLDGKDKRVRFVQ